MKKDFRTLLCYVGSALFAAAALSGISVALLHLFAPEKVEHHLSSVDAKVTELFLAFAVYSAVGLQVALYFYLPTNRRLALKLIFWGCTFTFAVPLQMFLASLTLKYTPEPAPNEPSLVYALEHQDLSWASCVGCAFGLLFVFMMYCKYQALNEQFLADVD